VPRSQTTHEDAPARERSELYHTAERARHEPSDAVQHWASVLGAPFAALHDGVYVCDAQAVRPVNRAALTLLGYSRQEEFPHDLPSLLRELAVRVRDGGEPLPVTAHTFPSEASVRELIIRHRETGEDRFVRCAVAPIVGAGRVAGAVVVASDTTARACSEADAKKRAEFEQQLIGIVSHDLRNPLQVIRFAAALGLRSAAGDPRLTRHFERITSSSARALRMIDDLFDFTRIRFAGGLAVEAKAVDLHELTRRGVEELLTAHPERSVEIEAAGDGHGWWDPDRLEQVVQNLVGNALQHTTEGTPVRVSTRGEPEQVVFEVHNAGPGIPREDQARLFEPFQRGKRKGSSGRSMGLGLHITSHIAQAHGGTLELDSSDQRGTTFTVRLPRGRPPEKD
jgi:signal transduction histidine kinase